MMSIIKLGIGMLTVIGTLVLLVLMAISEMSFMDLTFAKFFGAFAVMASIAFFVLTRKDDNEETNPAKENVKK